VPLLPFASKRARLCSKGGENSGAFSHRNNNVQQNRNMVEVKLQIDGTEAW
jgi:hypothetical protein